MFKSFNKHNKSGRVIVYLLFQKIEMSDTAQKRYNESSLHYEVQYNL